jgi:predicted hotdog family 3-hydroxylacyl-ACP dehydratase
LLAAILQPAMDELVALVSGGGAPSSPAQRRHVVERYVDLVASHAALIKVLSDDPSVRRSHVLGAALPQFQRLVEVLSGSEHPSVMERARVRAALGAVHATLVRADPADDQATLREVAVSVALAVLGLPASRAGARPPARRGGPTAS